MAKNYEEAHHYLKRREVKLRREDPKRVIKELQEDSIDDCDRLESELSEESSWVPPTDIHSGGLWGKEPIGN